MEIDGKKLQELPTSIGQLTALQESTTKGAEDEK